MTRTTGVHKFKFDDDRMGMDDSDGRHEFDDDWFTMDHESRRARPIKRVMAKPPLSITISIFKFKDESFHVVV